jgi:hypothetical protein
MEKIHYEELHNMYSSPNTFKVKVKGKVVFVL